MSLSERLRAEADLAESSLAGLEHDYAPDDPNAVLYASIVAAERQLAADLRLAADRLDLLDDAGRVLGDAERTLTQALGIIVEFGNLNGFRNLSDEELGRTVLEMATAGSHTLDDARSVLKLVKRGADKS